MILARGFLCKVVIFHPLVQIFISNLWIFLRFDHRSFFSKTNQLYQWTFFFSGMALLVLCINIRSYEYLEISKVITA